MNDEARASAQYIVHLKRELGLLSAELAATKAELEQARGALAAAEAELEQIRTAGATGRRLRARFRA